MSQERKIDIQFDKDDALLVEYSIKGPDTPRRWSRVIPFPGQDVRIDYFQDAGSEETIFFLSRQEEPDLVETVKYTLWEAHQQDPSALPEVINKLQSITEDHKFSVRRLTKLASVIFDLEKLIEKSQ